MVYGKLSNSKGMERKIDLKFFSSSRVQVDHGSRWAHTTNIGPPPLLYFEKVRGPQSMILIVQFNKIKDLCSVLRRHRGELIVYATNHRLLGR